MLFVSILEFVEVVNGRIFHTRNNLNININKYVDNLERIAKVELPEINFILASENTTYYRNKLEFTFSNNRWLTKDEINTDKKLDRSNALGFHVPRIWDKIVNINNCYLQKEPSNSIRLEVKKYADDHNRTYFDLRKQAGLLRNLIIRTSTTNELMVIVVFIRMIKKISINCLIIWQINFLRSHH